MSVSCFVYINFIMPSDIFKAGSLSLVLFTHFLNSIRLFSPCYLKYHFIMFQKNNNKIGILIGIEPNTVIIYFMLIMG